jgi:hydroxyacylglutathione hydrolase
MLFRQILQDDLGCASYLIADGGEAVVVDPQWEIGGYLEAAREAGAEIRHVVETHRHADHVSGRRRLVAATGARVHLPADPDDPAAGGLIDGDVIRIGAAELRAVAAPGHRPEHLAFTLTCHGDPGGGRLLTGDSLLVGGIARPDLAVAAEEGADALFDTLRRYKTLDPATEVWPAHVGASLCGSGNVASATSSTLADELQTNALLAIEGRAAFVAEITSGSPARPPRIARVVALNAAGAEPPPPLEPLGPAGLAGALRRGAVVLDIRDAEAFDATHLIGALNLVPVGSGLGNRAGWATRETDAIVIVADDQAGGVAFAERLYAAGIWNLVGIHPADPAAWPDAGLAIGRATALTPELVASALAAGRLELLDVRDPSEWRVAHLDGARNLPLSELLDGRTNDLGLDPEVHYAVACAGGARAALATTIVRRAGHAQVTRMSGGIAELLSCVSGRSPSSLSR